eukprot:TRINITY_DN889_c0_g1_i10.p3 TRINITY_DN889_c0_g1~~TRINITY_DN889_c0_g1_i10.p3  ORF type:complete len:110 (-),score=9.27 TRINITY_DN889_c0_g1_i10:1602-1904(-)
MPPKESASGDEVSDDGCDLVYESDSESSEDAQSAEESIEWDEDPQNLPGIKYKSNRYPEGPKNDISKMSPYRIFREMLTVHMVNTICQHSIEYANQQGRK